jgi:AAA domain
MTTPTSGSPAIQGEPIRLQRRPFTGKVPCLENVTSETKKLPNRVVLHAVQKWGKTSFAAQAPSPIFIMTRGEDGLTTLIDSKQIKPTKHYPDCMQTWNDLKLVLNELIVKEHPFKTVVLDTLNGAERLCHEFLCEEEYKGNWTDFNQWAQGQRASVKQMIELTQLLDRLREKGMGIICLCHSQVKTFNNPQGPNYDRWEPLLAKESWGHIDRWADMILFGDFEVFTDKLNKNKSDAQTKAKASGGQQRMLRCTRSPAYDAGNRHGLPDEIECGETPEEAWKNFIEALRAGKGQDK